MNRRLLAFVLAGTLSMAFTAAGQNHAIQVGYCTPLRNIDAARAAGFEYVELSTSEIAGLSDAEYEQAATRIRDVGLPVPVTNLFLPAAIKVTGANIDPAQQMMYVEKAFSRLARLGTQIVVFGSGGARRVPDDFPKDQAFRQLVEFGRRVAPAARAHGITIAIEPLRREETNIINAVNDPNFQLMVDFYHLAAEKEDPAIIVRAGAHIRHLHMANPQGRVFPRRWDEYDYAPFFATLRQIGYDKRISVEASTPDFATDAPLAITLLRRAFQ